MTNTYKNWADFHASKLEEKSKLFIQIHILKNYPYANLNRDDFGTPKTVYFGQKERGRISSACIKRPIRLDLKESLGEDYVGIRTRRMPLLVAKQLEDRGVDPEIIATVKQIIANFGKNDLVKDDTNKQIISYKPKTAECIADYLIDNVIKDISPEEFAKLYKAPKDEKVKGESKEEADKREKALKAEKKEIKSRRNEVEKQVKAVMEKLEVPLDFALFGTFQEIEGAMCVAHAVGTHEVNIESDFFTAVDDVQQEEDSDPGSGHLNTADYDSCCFYEYFSCGISELMNNLSYIENPESFLSTIIPELVYRIALSNPSGKKNSTGTDEVPQAILVELSDEPINYVNAFVDPVSPAGGKDLVTQSTEALIDYVNKIYNKINRPERSLWFSLNDIPFEEAEAVESLNDLCVQISDFDWRI